MTVVSEDLRRSARAAFERSDHHRLKRACHAILEANPHDADARRLMGLAALRDDRPDLAEAWFREAAARRPDSASVWRDLARALVAMRRESEAEAILSAASARGVRTAGSLTMLGLIRTRLDRLEDARAAFEGAIELDPARGDAYWGLAEVAGLAPGDPAYAQAERFLAAGRVPPPAAVAARFALAEADRLDGRFDSFVARVEEANALHRRLIARRDAAGPDPLARLRREAADAAKTVRRAASRGEDEQAERAPTPIFLLGERCSGAALAEAMLASEPGVFAAGEANLVSGAVAREIARATRRSGLSGAASLNPKQRATARAAYLERAARMAPDARWFVDRSPDLAASVDVLRLLFPSAAIVRLERSGVQQGLDVFRRYWTDADPRLCDLHAIGRDLRAARRTYAGLLRRDDLGVAVVDADELLAAPLEAGGALRAAAGLPVSLSTFSSPRIRHAAARLARFPDDLLAGHPKLVTPLKRGLGEFARS